MRAAYLVSTRIPPQHLVVGLRVEGHFDKGWFLGKIVSVQTLKKSKRIRVHYDDGEEQIYDSHQRRRHERPQICVRGRAPGCCCPPLLKPKQRCHRRQPRQRQRPGILPPPDSEPGAAAFGKAAAAVRTAPAAAGVPQPRTRPRLRPQPPLPRPRQHRTSAPEQREAQGAPGRGWPRAGSGGLMELERLRRGAARGVTSGPAAAGPPESPCPSGSAASSGHGFLHPGLRSAFFGETPLGPARSMRGLLPGTGGSSAVSSRNFWMLGSRTYGLPLPVQTGLNSNFMIFGLMAAIGWVQPCCQRAKPNYL